MRPRTIKYYIREGFRSLVTNRLMSLASIFAVASSIFIVAVFYIIGGQIEFFMEQLEGTLGMVAFVEEDVEGERLVQIENQIRANLHVANTVFVSRHDALDEMEEMFGDLLYGLQGDANPLRDSFHIELVNIAFQEDAARVIENIAGVAWVRRDTDLQAALTTMNGIVQLIIAGLLLVLGLISIIIIINTIRITVNNRQTEINIMKYVGATDWFIRWPFIIEGILIGLIGGAIPAFLVWVGYSHSIEALSGIPELQFLEFLPSDYIFMYVLPFAVIIGTAIGFLGSAVSVGRHLKV